MTMLLGLNIGADIDLLRLCDGGPTPNQSQNGSMMLYTEEAGAIQLSGWVDGK